MNTGTPNEAAWRAAHEFSESLATPLQSEEIERLAQLLDAFAKEPPQE
jgi:DNA replication protein DnaD